MRTAAITALGLLFAAGSAYAQSSYDYRDRDDSRSDSYSGRSYGQNYGRDSGGDRSSRSSDWSRDDHHGMNRGGRGATFYLKSGDREFRVDCGDDESTRECVDAALMMYRQVQDPTRTTSGSYSPSTGSTTGSATGSTSSAPGSSVSPGGPSGSTSSTGGSSTGR